MRERGQRRYLSYVRERLIALWKVHAVLEEVEPPRRPSAETPVRIEEAKRRKAALLGTRAPTVWPWAFQLGRTLTAPSLKEKDVLWIVARLSGRAKEG